MTITILYIISAVCLWILLSAIALDFYFSARGVVRKTRKSVVDTGSMMAFFLAMTVLAATGTGRLPAGDAAAVPAALAGTVLIAAGTAVNIAGRLKLGGNWGNQIHIYEGHTLITDGIYKYVRHPLYASTILMLVGFSLLFFNIVILLSVALIFTPFMVYRARQEDDMLLAAFQDDFIRYRSVTGSFFPKLRK